MEFTDKPLPSSRREADAGHGVPEAYWRSLQWFNSYRALVACLLFAAASFWSNTLQFGARDMPLFLASAAVYAAFAIAMSIALRTRERFAWQLAIQICGDIGFIVVLMYASGGLSSGLGLLLLTSLAAAGLVARGRMTLFFAAMATIAVLLEQTYEVLRFSEGGAQYAQAGFLSVAYFATAWLAHELARRSLASERLAAQREIDLANMAQVNQLVIQDMEHGVIVVDGAGVVRHANSAAERMVRGVRGKGVIALKDRIPALHDRFQDWLQGRQEHETPGVFDLANLRARLVPVAPRRGAGAVIFLEDLERIRSEARQLKLAALGRLTANIAHEIRNPLGAISHAAELLQEESGVSGGAQQRLITIIRDNTRRLDRMINDVQSLNRGERAERERFRLGGYLRGFIEQFVATEKLDASIIDLHMMADPYVLFDRDHLNQVLWNLCRNALRHCQRRAGSIRLLVQQAPRGNAVRLDVVDDGLGVPPESRGKLFEPFFTTAPGGTGLGLYLAREICEANDAQLEYAESSGGARFSVTCAAG